MRKGWVLALALVLVGGVSWAEDSELEVLRAKLAAQEARMSNQDARMRDLEAKMIGSQRPADATEGGITSLRKNAVVTVGGFASPSYVGHKYKVDSIYNNEGGWNVGDNREEYRRRAEAKTGSFELVEAEIHVALSIGENIDGWVALDVNGGSPSTDGWWVAKEYWVRWKDICGSGFGVKAGRDTAAFGGIAYGYMDSYATLGDGASWLWQGAFANNANVLGDAARFPVFDENGDFTGLVSAALGSMPLHNYWLMKGVTQITPYWESKDGKFLWEVSLIQDIDVPGAFGYGGHASGRTDFTSHVSYRRNNELIKYRSTNYGLSSMSTRITWKPIEGLQIIGGFMNLHKNGFSDGYGFQEMDVELGKNNSSTYLGFEWRPCFLPKLNIWGQWVHGWNVANIKDLDSDAFNLGVAWSFTDKFTVFAQGDYLRSKYDGRGRFSGYDYDNKGTAWVSYVGAQYDFGNGLALEAGWRHEEIKYKEEGQKVTKIKGDMVYASLLVSF